MAQDPAAQALARLRAQPRPDLPPPPPPAAPRNGFAIASLVTGIATFFGGALFSIIFGIIALVQIRRRGQRGKRLAIAGLSITSAHLVVLAVFIIIAAVNHSPLRGEDGELIRSGSIETDELQVGDCIERLNDGLSASVPGVPCAEPHLAEVYATFDVDGDWPGQEPLAEQAERSCVSRLLSTSPSAFDDPTVGVFYAMPSRISWTLGDREVVCFAIFLDSPRSDSILDN